MISVLETDNNSGVRASYSECLEITTLRLLKTIDTDNFHNVRDITLNIHDGIDGSGSHSIFNQKALLTKATWLCLCS